MPEVENRGAGMKKIRVKTSDLKQGMRVAEDVYALNGTLIALKNSIINKKLISIFQHYKIRDINIQRDSISENYAGHVATRQFKECFQKLHADIKDSFQKIVVMDDEINPDEIIRQLEMLIEEAGSGFELLNMLLDMGEEKDSTYQHSIQVAMLSRVIGGWAGLPEQDIAQLGIAGLFHDIGKCCIEAAVLNKTEPLSEKEHELVRQHAVMGYKIVKDKNLDSRIKQAILSHHERCDGTGYPLGLKFASIGQFARVVAIADVFAAMTANRPYRGRSFSPFEVVSYLEKEGFGKFDSEYLMCFLPRVLNSYIKRRVRLNDEQIGEIVFINKSNLSRPLLKISGGYLDLALNPELSIVEIL